MYPITRRFLKEYLPGHYGQYAWGVFFLLLTIGVTVVIPGRVRDGVAILETSGARVSPESIAELHRIAWIIIACGAGLIVLRTLSRVILFLPGRKIEADLRQNFFSSALSLPHERLDSMATGDLVSRATNDITSVRVLLSMGVLHIINSVLTMVFCLLMMLRISGRLTFICTLLVPLVVLVVRYLSSNMMRQVRAVQRQLGELTGTVREQLRAHMLLTIYPVFDGVMTRFDKQNDLYCEQSAELQRTRVFLFNVAVTLASIALFVLLIAGGPMVVRGEFKLSQFVEFSIYLGLIQDPLRAWGFLISIFQRGEVCLKRLYDLSDLAVTYRAEQANRAVADSGALAAANAPASPILTVQNLLYHYPVRESDTPDAPTARPFALEVDRLELQAGRRYGFFGATGSGKTTLAELLTGNREAPAGTLLFHGVRYETIATEILMRQLSYVPQENRHFNQSIHDNLSQITEAAGGFPGFCLPLAEAMRVSCLDRDVEGFKNGVETVIGEHGVRLSGGQKQRLALVRALLKPHRVLVLDDVVSAVDHETESQILSRLFAALPADDTLLIISHRISALSRCDVIFILDDGRIVATGSHEELLNSHEGYRATWQHQMIEQQLEELRHGQ